jgi:hypothetical protein
MAKTVCIIGTYPLVYKDRNTDFLKEPGLPAS